jgi:hypothetical protein
LLCYTTVLGEVPTLPAEKKMGCQTNGAVHRKKKTEGQGEMKILARQQMNRHFRSMPFSNTEIVCFWQQTSTHTNETRIQLVSDTC